MALPTVADLKVHLDIESTSNDGELADHLDAAVAMVEGLTGPLTTGTVSETHYGVASPTVLLRRITSSLSTVTARRNAYYGDEVIDCVLDPDSGVIRLADGGYFYGDVTVTYSAGRVSIPADIRMAILIIAGHLWETQRGNTSGGPLAAETDPSFGTPGAGYALPNRARDSLAPYIRSSSIA